MASPINVFAVLIFARARTRLGGCSLLTREHSDLLEYWVVVTGHPYPNRLTYNKSCPSECMVGVTAYLYSYGLAKRVCSVLGYWTVVTRCLYPSASATIIAALWVRPFNGGCLVNSLVTGAAAFKDSCHIMSSFVDLCAYAWVSGVTLAHLRNPLRAPQCQRVSFRKTIACLACGLSFSVCIHVALNLNGVTALACHEP